MDYSGQTLGERYRILRLIGKGGMGSVWLGQHVVIGRRVAVKFLKAELAESEEMVKRFYREAQAAASIAHGNIIDILDVGVSSVGDPYIVMEYLEGESLAVMLDRTGPIDLPAALGILEPTLLALAAAHEKGIIHRDLKPENIFLCHAQDEPLKVKLIDFGISKFTEHDSMTKLTRTGTLLGTPTYMSPEQIRGDKELDHRADLYSVGVILYKMLTGKLPFKGEHHNAIIAAVLTENPTPPRESCADFPTDAESILMRLLSKDPAGRPDSARKIIEEIKQITDYEKRESRLSLYASGISEKRCALGDLGDNVGSGRGKKGAHDILAEISGKPTPADWSQTIMPGRRRMGIRVGLAAVVLAIPAVIVMLLWPSSEKPPVNEIPKASASAAPIQAPKPAQPSKPIERTVPDKSREIEARAHVGPLTADTEDTEETAPSAALPVEKSEEDRAVKKEKQAVSESTPPSPGPKAVTEKHSRPKLIKDKRGTAAVSSFD